MSTAVALHTDPNLKRLVEYLQTLGGSAALVAGWSSRNVARKQSRARVQDVYYFSPENVKYRSLKEVAEHFELLEPSGRVIGECPPAAVDAKLWRGAQAQGWSVFSRRDGHNVYTAPDGRTLRNKDEVQAWCPGGPPPKKRRCHTAVAPPLLLQVSVERNPPSTEAPPGMGPVRAALERIGLEQYAAALDDLGYDDLDYLGIFSEEGLREVAVEAGMKKGARFQVCGVAAHRPARHVKNRPLCALVSGTRFLFLRIY